MRLLKKYRPVINFIFVFCFVYFSLSLAYNFYLNWSAGSSYFPDYVTNLVARQSSVLTESFGYSVELMPHDQEPSIKVVLNDKYLARIVEGCNSISIIILFLSFVLAFSGKLKKTILFIVAGSVLIYTINLVRISILTIGLYLYPWRDEVLHTVIFPLIIYGLVFLLWMLWVKIVINNNS